MTTYAEYRYGCKILPESEPISLYAVECGGALIGWINFRVGEGWFPYCHDGGCSCLGGPMSKKAAIEALKRTPRGDESTTYAEYMEAVRAQEARDRDRFTGQDSHDDEPMYSAETGMEVGEGLRLPWEDMGVQMRDFIKHFFEHAGALLLSEDAQVVRDVAETR